MFAVYEQIRPNDGFGRVMQQHFIQLSIPLLSLPFYPDKESQRNRYLKKVEHGFSHLLLGQLIMKLFVLTQGWSSCEVYDINEFVQQLIPSDELERMKQLETFDEYEGFHEKCSHYIILTATKGLICFCYSQGNIRSLNNICRNLSVITSSQTVCRTRSNY